MHEAATELAEARRKVCAPHTIAPGSATSLLPFDATALTRVRTPFSAQVDIVLLMSVNPGFGGQKFIPATLDKLAEAREMIDESGFDISLEIDGGVGPANIADVAKAGADNFVAGSAIFNTPDYKATIDSMRAELAKVPTPGKAFDLY